jgi:integration host factor subunit beta
MVKAELVSRIAQDLDMTKKEVALIVNTVFKGISQSLARGDKVEIRGFGSFRVKQRGPRQGRNPRTGEPVQVPAKRVPYFRAGKDLKIIA